MRFDEKTLDEQGQQKYDLEILDSELWDYVDRPVLGIRISIRTLGPKYEGAEDDNHATLELRVSGTPINSPDSDGPDDEGSAPPVEQVSSQNNRWIRMNMHPKEDSVRGYAKGSLSLSVRRNVHHDDLCNMEMKYGRRRRTVREILKDLVEYRHEVKYLFADTDDNDTAGCRFLVSMVVGYLVTNKSIDGLRINKAERLLGRRYTLHQNNAGGADWVTWRTYPMWPGHFSVRSRQTPVRPSWEQFDFCEYVHKIGKKRIQTLQREFSFNAPAVHRKLGHLLKHWDNPVEVDKHYLETLQLASSTIRASNAGPLAPKPSGSQASVPGPSVQPPRDVRQQQTSSRPIAQSSRAVAGPSSSARPPQQQASIGAASLALTPSGSRVTVPGPSDQPPRYATQHQTSFRPVAQSSRAVAGPSSSARPAQQQASIGAASGDAGVAQSRAGDSSSDEQSDTVWVYNPTPGVREFFEVLPGTTMTIVQRQRLPPLGVDIRVTAHPQHSWSLRHDRWYFRIGSGSVEQFSLAHGPRWYYN